MKIVKISRTLCIAFLFCVVIGYYFLILTERVDFQIKFKSTTTTPIDTSASAEHRPSFSQILSTFDWATYEKVIQNKQKVEIDFWLEKLIRLFSYFLILEPKVPVNTECKAPDLIPPEKLNCSSPGYGNGFNGDLNGKPRKIGILIQLGFHVDVMEIYLNEVFDVVDQFFILESTRSHYHGLKKSLMWEQVKNQERFVKFAPKIVHLLIDEADTSQLLNGNDTNIWNMEVFQERERWTKFLEWNAAFKFFEDDDLLGFGDADEIPARRTLHMLKHCSLKAEATAVDIGIWFPFGNINYAFKPDFPVPGHPYTLGDPTFWTLGSASKYFQAEHQPPNRRRGKGRYFILGGIHMTFYGYLPSSLMRYLTCSECGHDQLNINETRASIERDQIRKLEIKHSTVPLSFKSRIVPLEMIHEEMREIAILPWFYDCNRDRYPAWEGNHDTRLD